MKKTLVILAILLSVKSLAQRSNHSYFIGGNLTGIHLDLGSAPVKGLTHKDFADSKTGYNLGYKYLYSLSSRVAIGAGLEYKNVNCVFSRPYYDFPIMNPNLTSVKESLKFHRLSVPVQGYYHFIDKNNYSVYVTAGGNVILVNSVKRTDDYLLPSPPTGYIERSYTGTQTIKFNSSGIGISLFGGLGYEFTVKENTFYLELSYDGDVSQNKIPTLHNIEADSYYYGKLKSVQLKAGHIFSLKSRKK